MSVQGPLLVVEDDEDDQYMIRLALDQLNVPNPCLFFANGQEVLEYLLGVTEQPFLILCDINMPLMNGLELSRRINANDRLRQKSIPFVFLTTAANAEMVRVAYDQAAQGFYKKAASYDGLRDQLQLIVTYWKSCLHPNSTFL